MFLAHPSLLRPTTTEHLLVKGGQTLSVPKVELQLRRWMGPLLSHTFGGKPLLDFGGRPIFAELCVYELMRLSGWQARWVETYGAPALRPNHFTAWADAKPSDQQHDPITEDFVLDYLQRIAQANGSTYAGCWDVVAWHGTTLLFAELKRRKQDQIRDTQVGWLEAALSVGLGIENFLLVEWAFLK